MQAGGGPRLRVDYKYLYLLPWSYTWHTYWNSCGAQWAQLKTEVILRSEKQDFLCVSEAAGLDILALQTLGFFLVVHLRILYLVCECAIYVFVCVCPCEPKKLHIHVWARVWPWPALWHRRGLLVSGASPSFLWAGFHCSVHLLC